MPRAHYSDVRIGGVAKRLSVRAQNVEHGAALLRVRFSTRAIGVDMDDNVLRLATADTPSVGLAFDVLVGADGQDSAVRSALIARPGVNFKQHWVGRMSRAFFVATGTGPGVIPGDSMHTMLPRSLDHIEPPAEIEGADEEEEHEAAPDTRGVLALAASAVFHPRDALRYVMAVPDSVASVTPVHDGFIVELAWSAEAPPVPTEEERKEEEERLKRAEEERKMEEDEKRKAAYRKKAEEATKRAQKP